jgi:hypothetical protein
MQEQTNKAEKQKAEQTSTVRLTTFAIFREPKASDKNSEIEVLYGASAARRSKDGKIELLSSGIPFHSQAFANKAPKAGFGTLMLYGIRDSLEALHFWRAKARELGASFSSVQIEFSIGNLEVGLTDRALLKKSHGANRFLNFRRMKASLQSEILHKFTEYAKEEGVNIDEEMSRTAQIATRPDLFDRLLYEDKELKKLSILVIPVADDPEVPSRLRQVAYVKPGAPVVSMVQSNDDAKIVLPIWMTDTKAAKKYAGAKTATNE